MTIVEAFAEAVSSITEVIKSSLRTSKFGPTRKTFFLNASCLIPTGGKDQNTLDLPLRAPLQQTHEPIH